MIGAIIGDIVGSVYEWNNIKTKAFPFFQEKCFFTDDTVMTLAVAEGLMNGGEKDDFIDAMKKYGRMHPDAGYGGWFGAWLFSDSREPYRSWGNGSAMRTAAVGWYFDSLAATRRAAALAAGVTHDHPEGIKGAESTASAIFLARTGRGKAEIKEYVEREFGYDLGRTLDEIRPAYRFDESCQGTVPQAITAFLESADFEDAIRNAVSLGGDSDTLAAITGSIAEAAYGVPQWMKDRAWDCLTAPLRDVLRRWRRELPRGGERGAAKPPPRPPIPQRKTPKNAPQLEARFFRCGTGRPWSNSQGQDPRGGVRARRMELLKLLFRGLSIKIPLFPRSV